MNTHRVIVVHDGQTYAVVLLIHIRDGVPAISVIKVAPVSILGHPYSTPS